LPKTVAVIAGKPGEFGFALSSREVAPGLVRFTVTNKGKVIHSFKICTATTTRLSVACAGSVTKILKPDETATLLVRLTKGVHEFLCTIPGHASLGMRGLLGVAVNPPSVTTTSQTTTTTTTTQTTTTTTTQTTTTSDECPPGVTIQTSGNGDQDNDELGGPSDGDGCI
jgi:hypothetical protein